MAQSKIVGVGWAKTGTTTLGDCLEVLGFTHRRGMLSLADTYAEGKLDPIWAVADQYDSFEDWPWLLLYQQFDERYPGSKFILTVRDTAQWLASYRNMLDHQGEASEKLNQVRRALYGLPFPHVSDEALVERYEHHNDAVRRYFAGRSDFVEVNWARGDGWDELCDFLDLPHPRVAFPHANRGNYSWISKLKRGWRRSA